MRAECVIGNAESSLIFRAIIKLYKCFDCRSIRCDENLKRFGLGNVRSHSAASYLHHLTDLENELMMHCVLSEQNITTATGGKPKERKIPRNCRARARAPGMPCTTKNQIEELNSNSFN